MGKAFDETGADAFDPAWYAAAYPQAAEDIRRGRASDAHDHYLRLGRFRGYLPNARAERPRDPAAVRSAFGGLWTDQGNALDLVEGRHALGWIDRREADLLRSFITDGYVILRGAVPAWTLRRAAGALEDAYAGRMKALRFCCPDLGFEVGDWDARVRELPAKALEIHAHSAAVRDLILCKSIVRFLSLVFERPPMATQTLGFYRGSGQQGHQDTAYVTYSLPLQFAASWIALEDVTEGAGELFYRVGSHQLGDFLYDGRSKGVSDARRLNPDWTSEADEARHVESLVRRSEQLGYREERFLARRGDVLIWSADLVHGGKPTSTAHTRKSIVTHYCPWDVAPLYFETHRAPIRRHRSGAFYSTLL